MGCCGLTLPLSRTLERVTRGLDVYVLGAIVITFTPERKVPVRARSVVVLI